MQISEWDDISVNHVDNLVKMTASVLKACGFEKINMVDVGSNVGKFPERLMFHGVEVTEAILCDIVPQLVEYTTKKFPNYCSVHTAIGDKDGENVECYSVIGVSDNYGLSRIVEGLYGDERNNAINLTTCTLDTLLKTYNFKPDFVKIDAEGYDIPAVYGLLPALDRESEFRPVILFECAAGVSAVEIVEKLKLYGYETATSTPESDSRDIFVIPKNLLNADVAAALNYTTYKT